MREDTEGIILSCGPVGLCIMNTAYQYTLNVQKYNLNYRE